MTGPLNRVSGESPLVQREGRYRPQSPQDLCKSAHQDFVEGYLVI